MGFEPTTFSLGSQRRHEQSREVATQRGRNVDDVEGLATAVLALAQTEVDLPADLAIRLIDAVLASASEMVKLALAAREGGPHATRHLIDLASRVLSNVDDRREPQAAAVGDAATSPIGSEGTIEPE